MHIALAGIISQDAIDENLLLAFCEPAFLPVPCFCLCWRWCHHEPGPDSNDQCQDTFNQEEPAPSFAAVDTTKSEETVSEDWSDDICYAKCGPEKSKSEWELSAFEKVGLRLNVSSAFD